MRQTQYDYLWLAAAVCPENGESCALLLPYLDTCVLNLFLTQFSQQLESDVVAVLFWDGAPFHRGQDLVIPDNIRIWALPPYSPELNPLENLWHYLKSHFWSNRCYPDYDALLEAAQDAWQRVCFHPQLLQSICAAPYIA